MKIEDLKEAKAEAQRFIKKAIEFEKRLIHEKDMWGHSPERAIDWGFKESGAVKRSSMDLSRSLSKLRK